MTGMGLSLVFVCSAFAMTPAGQAGASGSAPAAPIPTPKPAGPTPRPPGAPLPIPVPLPPPATAGAVPTYRLAPRKGGGHVYDAPAPWRAVVAEDGQVTFEDRRLARTLRILPVFPADHPPGTVTLERTVKDLLAGRKPGRQPEVVQQPWNPAERATDDPPTPAEQKAWGEITKGLSVAHLDFGDLTTHYMAFVGEDAYRVEKARFLAATFETRLKMAKRHRLSTLRRGLHRLPQSLAAIWADSARPAVERRRIICELHLELASDEGGSKAGAIILDFVREKMPAGSEAAYPEAEIAACNVGRADDDPARFAPYPPAE